MRISDSITWSICSSIGPGSPGDGKFTFQPRFIAISFRRLRAMRAHFVDVCSTVFFVHCCVRCVVGQLHTISSLSSIYDIMPYFLSAYVAFRRVVSFVLLTDVC